MLRGCFTCACHQRDTSGGATLAIRCKAPHLRVIGLTCARACRPTLTCFKPNSPVPCHNAHYQRPSSQQEALRLTCAVTVQAGYDVLGSYCSPVNDAYNKPGLLPAAHRVRMCELAAGVAPAVMVDRCGSIPPPYLTRF